MRSGGHSLIKPIEPCHLQKAETKFHFYLSCFEILPMNSPATPYSLSIPSVPSQDSPGDTVVSLLQVDQTTCKLDDQTPMILKRCVSQDIPTMSEAFSIKNYDGTVSHEDRQSKGSPKSADLDDEFITVTCLRNWQLMAPWSRAHIMFHRRDCVNHAFMVTLLQRHHY